MSNTNLALSKAVLPADGWADAINTTSPLKGTIVRCNDGQWLRGKETTPINGTQWLALRTRDCWARWKDSRPERYLFREAGRMLPERDELGDLDHAAWEPGPSGEKRDPWQMTKFLYLANETTAELLTFSTSTFGGRGAIGDLADQIGLMRGAHPRAVPSVELANRPVQTRYGRKTWPHLKVVGWRNLEPTNGQPAIVHDDDCPE
jgi:hypothetical protein